MYKWIAQLTVVPVIALFALLMECSLDSYASANLFQGNAFGLSINSEISSSLPSSSFSSNGASLFQNTSSGLPVIDNLGVSGSGTGSITCSDGARIDGGSISFFAFKSNALYGSWEVVSIRISGTSQNAGGSFQTGVIGSNQFTLTGREISDSICRGSPPTPATISGQCGQGVTIELNADNGEKGNFTGDVTCS
ncbi:MAG: hypothetical protein WA667_14620 [Candidatus Nitrosopolaris sp.]